MGERKCEECPKCHTTYKGCDARGLKPDVPHSSCHGCHNKAESSDGRRNSNRSRKRPLFVSMATLRCGRRVTRIIIAVASDPGKEQMNGALQRVVCDHDALLLAGGERLLK